MGVGLSAPIVYDEPVKTRYRANSLGSWVLEGVGLLTVLIIPFVIGIAMGQFWLQYNVFVTPPEVSFSNKCLMRAQTFSGQVLLFGCSATVGQMLAGDPRRVEPFFSLLQDDRDGDGKVDVFEFTFQLPLDTRGDSIAKFEFLPAFQYKIENYILDVEMEAAPYVVAASGTNDGSNLLTLEGQLKFSQLHPLHSSTYVRYDRVYNFSHFDDRVRDVNDINNVGALAARYARRNESATFHPTLTAFSTASFSDVDEADAFSVSLTMRVGDAVVQYVPSTAELLKHAWVQYFAIAYVIHWAMSWIRALFVKQAFVNTIALYQDVKTMWRTGGR